eukprot:COSAG03_NODE_6692_length_1019_cov_1.269565_1_plen_219_part_01
MSIASLVLSTAAAVSLPEGRPSSDSPPLHRGGIDARCLGTVGVDFASEQLYHDAAVDGTRTLAVKANTGIVLEHNARNSIQMTDTGSGDAVQWDAAPAAWNVSEDSGIIRYRVDRDLNWKYHWSPGDPAPSKCGKSFGGPPNMALPAVRSLSRAHLSQLSHLLTCLLAFLLTHLLTYLLTYSLSVCLSVCLSLSGPPWHADHSGFGGVSGWGARGGRRW